MVILGEEKEREGNKLMAMKPERSKPLHNFPMPCLKWGRQRYLRCIKLNSDVQLHQKPSASEVEGDLIGRRGSSYRKQNLKMSPSPSPAREVGWDGIEAIREKVMLDIQMAADKMKDQIFRERLDEDAKPWNLRSKRAACKALNGVPIISPLKSETKSTRLRGAEKRERSKFSVSLSREEIEQDFMAMTGKKLPRRPTKRPKTLQKQLDTLFPGLWLTEITADSYKVSEDAKS